MSEGETINIGGLDFVVISTYTLADAINDGVLVPLFLDEMPGKPVVATANLLNAIGLEAVLQVWRDFQVWDAQVKDTLPEEDQLYAPEVGEYKLFVIEDGVAFTLMLREDY